MVCLNQAFRPVAGVCTALSLLVVPSIALADATNDPTGATVVDPNAGFSSPEGGGSIFDDASGPMDLIHRAVLMNDMSLSDFQRQQQGRFADEAANFRQMQQEALRRQVASPEAESTPVEAIEEDLLEAE